jgi:hypothetical protein
MQVGSTSIVNFALTGGKLSKIQLKGGRTFQQLARKPGPAAA